MNENNTLSPDELEAAAMAAEHTTDGENTEVDLESADETAEESAELTDADKCRGRNCRSQG